jgi:hypothetical protein
MIRNVLRLFRRQITAIRFTLTVNGNVSVLMQAISLVPPILLEIKENGSSHRFAFSGDIGGPDFDTQRPASMGNVNYIISESTCGAVHTALIKWILSLKKL